MNLSEAERAIEAILFAAGYPVLFSKIAEVLEMSKDEVKQTVAMLSDRYADRGIQLIVYEDSCQLCTKEEYEGYVRNALGLRGAGALSASLLEVLAIIAYNQPVTRAFIEQVRGVDSSYAVSTLCEKQLIECTGRLDVPGKPMLFSTTETFLRVFGISSVAELPKTELLDVISDNNTMNTNADILPVEESAAEEKTENT